MSETFRKLGALLQLSDHDVYHAPAKNYEQIVWDTEIVLLFCTVERRDGVVAEHTVSGGVFPCKNDRLCKK